MHNRLYFSSATLGKLYDHSRHDPTDVIDYMVSTLFSIPQPYMLVHHDMNGHGPLFVLRVEIELP